MLVCDELRQDGTTMEFHPDMDRFMEEYLEAENAGKTNKCSRMQQVFFVHANTKVQMGTRMTTLKDTE
jgi:hypothetical protein